MLRRIQDPNIWTIYAAIVLLGIAYGTAISVLAIHLDAHGIPKIAMGGLAAAFAAGIAVFALPAGYFVARFGAKKVLFASLLGYAVCVASFPFIGTLTTLTVLRFLDGASSANVWVSAETALLARAKKEQKGLIMSLYALSIAMGYLIGPIVAALLVHGTATTPAFLAAGVLATIASMVVLVRLSGDDVRERESHDDEGADAPPDVAAERSAFRVLWRIKTACLATFSYGYFQASVVLFLPLFLMKERGIAPERTIYVTAFFALGMLLTSSVTGRLGDRYGHLLVMRLLGGVGGSMVASFVFLPTFELMCVAVFVAGATLGAISPVSLALQGVVTPKADLGRANAFYNAAYATGMLLGPPISSVFFSRWGGASMLLHLTAVWATFVLVSVVFAKDDPRARPLAQASVEFEPVA